MSELLDQTCRVAFSALIHDIGKFSQRAGLDFPKEKIEVAKQLYCPRTDKGIPTHAHVAYTSLSYDQIEKYCPDLIKGDQTPFSSRSELQEDKAIDTVTNAASMHHTPETFLQAVIARADRVASGFERQSFEQYNITDEQEPESKGRNYRKERLLTLFEQVSLPELGAENKPTADKDLSYRYRLAPMSVESIFPNKEEAVTPSDEKKAKEEYANLWNSFLEGLSKIPSSHKQNWSLWLDHFDSLWLTYTQAIPSATYPFKVKPDVSLYDHSKATAAIAASLWRWYSEKQIEKTEAYRDIMDTSSSDNKQLLFIQGDFSGIQSFIFAEGAQTNKKAAKILRGRSFYVSLVSEIAALKVLEKLDLPSTSQIMNAAGKFLIVAPNTEATVSKLEQVKREIDSWFVEHTLGIAGLCIATNQVSCTDLTEKKFSKVMADLFASLEIAKLQKLNLTGKGAVSTLDVTYPNGVCAWNQYLPADTKFDGEPCSQLSLDQINIGDALAKNKDRLVILSSEDSSLANSAVSLKQSIFGYSVYFCEDSKAKDLIKACVANRSLRRYWDLSMPKLPTEAVWNGCARRNINSYVPRALADDPAARLYDHDLEKLDIGEIKSFGHLACEDRKEEKDSLIGIRALGCLKGDIDNLGLIFQSGLVGANKDSFSFARMAALSRQVNAFFSVYLPYLCNTDYPSMYTIFAGGDDFFFVGPWNQTQRFAEKIREKFSEFCANSPQLHFSAGISTVKPGIPIRSISRFAEDALDKAKQIRSKDSGKNAITVFGCTVKWSTWNTLRKIEAQLNNTKDEFGLNNTYLYSMFYMIRQANKEKQENNPEAAIWRSQLSYRTYRWIRSNVKDKNSAEVAMRRILSVTYEPIEKFGEAFMIPLSNVFYSLRK